MFEAMMGQIEDDFVRYVFHLQVVVDEEPRPDLRNVSYSAPTDPVQGEGAIAAAFAAEPELPAADPAPDRWTGDDADGDADADDARGRSSSRCGSRRRRAATSRASAGAARSTSSATGADFPCSDFSEDLG